MNKILELENIKEDKIISIEYKPNKVKGVGMIGLIVDIIVFLMFDWWIWLPIWIFNFLFNIKIIKEANQLSNDVHTLLNTGWQPVEYDDAYNLVYDFNLSINLIGNKEWAKEISRVVVERRFVNN